MSNATEGERLIVDQVEFRFWKDGDLEIDIGTNVSGEWAGRFLSREATLLLRDWLNKALP